MIPGSRLACTAPWALLAFVSALVVQSSAAAPPSAVLPATAPGSPANSVFSPPASSAPLPGFSSAVPTPSSAAPPSALGGNTPTVMPSGNAPVQGLPAQNPTPNVRSAPCIVNPHLPPVLAQVPATLGNRMLLTLTGQCLRGAKTSSAKVEVYPYSGDPSKQFALPPLLQVPSTQFSEWTAEKIVAPLDSASWPAVNSDGLLVVTIEGRTPATRRVSLAGIGGSRPGSPPSTSAPGAQAGATAQVGSGALATRATSAVLKQITGDERNLVLSKGPTYENTAERTRLASLQTQTAAQSADAKLLLQQVKRTMLTDQQNASPQITQRSHKFDHVIFDVNDKISGREKYFTPGGTYSIAGRGFGTTPGRVYLYHSINAPLNLRVEHWQKDLVIASLDAGISGIPDAADRVLVVEPPGQKPLELPGVTFHAARDKFKLTAIPQQFYVRDFGSPPRTDITPKFYSGNNDFSLRVVRVLSNVGDLPFFSPGQDLILLSELSPGYKVDTMVISHGPLNVDHEHCAWDRPRYGDSATAWIGSEVTAGGYGYEWTPDGNVLVRWGVWRCHLSPGLSNSAPGLGGTAQNEDYSMYQFDIWVVGPRGVPVFKPGATHR